MVVVVRVNSRKTGEADGQLPVEGRRLRIHDSSGHFLDLWVSTLPYLLVPSTLPPRTESLTDPSYRGQILVITFPLIGNYGVADDSLIDEYGLPKRFESSEIHVAGLIISSYSEDHSHWAAAKSLGMFFLCLFSALERASQGSNSVDRFVTPAPIQSELG